MGLSERSQSLLLVGLLLVGGAVVWSVQLRPPLAAEPASLSAVPDRFDGWRVVGEPRLEETAEAMLRADFNLQRLYWHPTGTLVELYVGYYGTERGGRPEHTPEVCYPSNGWRIQAQRTVVADSEAGLRANEFRAERAGEVLLVHYWYRTYRRTGLLGGFDHLLDRLVGRLIDDRSDGALVRVATSITDGDEVGARGRLVAFSSALDPLIGDHWPVEAPRVPTSPAS